jgi:hypothetical protein
MNFQDIYCILDCEKYLQIFFGNMYSLKSNYYFQGTLTYVQHGFLYLILTSHKFTVHCTYEYIVPRILTSFKQILFKF